ncbi:MAG: hypothetical protein M1832_001814 [Thelocarpon impressellum]|nr:MAG: hypothetical protein M1832_001814 [Thelocarpon impressellum]
MVRELLLSVKKLSSDVLVKLLHQIMSLDVQSSTLTDEVSAIRKDLDTLTESRDSSDDPFRSEHDLRHETLRTTIVAQKVEISKQRSSLSEKDSAYSKIVHRTHKCLQRYFTTSLVSPQSLFLHEVFFYDLKSPHRDVFTPKQRHAVERALATPHDYLGCTCCGENAEGLSSTQPATAILYQLYLESGALINVFDLWSAFYAIVGGENGEDCDEANAMALFYRALADLKYLGTIKHSRKKTDHITKLAWKGL